jgi:hypothetical protein
MCLLPKERTSMERREKGKGFWFLMIFLLAGMLPGMGRAAQQSVGVIVRNPFQPPSAVTRRLLVKKVVPATPLQKYDVESFALRGVVADRAMVLSPDGEVYVVKKGTRIGRRGEVVVGVYRDRLAVKRGDKVIYLSFPKE